LFNELPLQMSGALLLVKRNENPFSFADLFEQHRIVSRAAEKLSMPLVSDSGAIQRFDQLIIVEVVVQIEREAFRRRFWLLRAR